MLGFCCPLQFSFHRGLFFLGSLTEKPHWLNLNLNYLSPFPHPHTASLMWHELCNAGQSTAPAEKQLKGCLHFQNPKFYHIALALQNRCPLVLEPNHVLKVSTLGVKVRVLISLQNVQEKCVTGDDPAIFKTYAVHIKFIYFFLFVRPHISQ